jgi:hypothetical protein
MTRRENFLNLLLIVGSIICALVVSEIALRLVSHEDSDGNVSIGKLRLRPLFLPVNNLTVKHHQFIEKEHSYLQYDPDLGWSVRPSSQSEDGLYSSNATGVRTANVDQETSPKPSAGIFRIAIFGDSFTHGADVPFEDSWGAILEILLTRNDIKAEVLNLGTPGYGMDQAFLRWKKHGNPLQPHLVLFGFQHSNVLRNMNIIRMLYSPDSGIIFSKPRFILLPGEPLDLVNSPAATPRKILTIFSDFDNWPLKEHEFYYQEADYQMSPFHASRLAAFAISGLTNRFSSRRKDYDFFAETSVSRQLAEGIIEAFQTDVLEAQARFVIVHLPTQKPLRDLLKEKPLEYQDLLDTLASQYHVIDPALELMHQAKAHSLDDLFAPESHHYSAIGNSTVAEAIAVDLLRTNP